MKLNPAYVLLRGWVNLCTPPWSNQLSLPYAPLHGGGWSQLVLHSRVDPTYIPYLVEPIYTPLCGGWSQLTLPSILRSGQTYAPLQHQANFCFHTLHSVEGRTSLHHWANFSFHTPFVVDGGISLCSPLVAKGWRELFGFPLNEVEAMYIYIYNIFMI